MRSRILVTMPEDQVFRTFFDQENRRALEALGEVEWNRSGRQFTPEELRERLKDRQICVTGWGSPVFQQEILDSAPELKLIAHTGGSVKPYVTEAVYERGIRVVSGNRVFAESVAESVIAYALSSLRDIPYYSSRLKEGYWPEQFCNRGLLDRSVGIVGYGMISGYLVRMLQPFHNSIKVYSRHIEEQELEKWNMQRAGLEEIFSQCDIISIHSGMTKENYHLITEDLLRKMKPGALLINTARGAVIDEEALVRVLQDQDIYAVLDVYEKEPLPTDHPLTKCPRAILMPHMGGPTIDRRLVVAKAVIGDIARFQEGKEMDCEIVRTYARTMSGG